MRRYRIDHIDGVDRKGAVVLADTGRASQGLALNVNEGFTVALALQAFGPLGPRPTRSFLLRDKP